MKRDAVAADVERLALYLDGGNFAWYHHDPGAAARGAVAVLCPPIGHEYTRSHRTVRHLADRLARAGIPALRFDYHGTGDSPGDDLDPGRFERWQDDIAAAIDRARTLSGCEAVHLVGLRLGASLAALAARERRVERLVLWNPVIRGKRYVRELQAIAQSAAQSGPQDDGRLECAGFVLNAQTVDSLRALDLLQHDYRAGAVLVLGRDDMASDESLSAHLETRGVPNEFVHVAGWAGVVAEHQFTVVPDAALETIVAWLARSSSSPGAAARVPARTPPSSISFRDRESADEIHEEAGRFGAAGRLFGIVTRPAQEGAKSAVLLFNAGSVHHVGPNRAYVTLARRLAAAGHTVLRFDLESLGDSVAPPDRRENYPYPPQAVSDALAAAAWLRERHGCDRFVGLGLCAGAHTAFHAALADPRLVHVVLVNPLSFYWDESMSLEIVDHFADAKAYRESARDPRRWLKLLRGEVNVKRLVEVATAQAKTLARARLESLLETVAPSRAPRLARDLRRLFARGQRVTIVVAEGDPGRDVLMAGARRTATRALASGDIVLRVIPGADHTFSRARPRELLFETLLERLAPDRAIPPRHAAH